MRVHREIGRPLPRFSDDDVVDYCVAEAIVAKDHAEQEKAQKEQQRAKRRGSHKKWQPGQGFAGEPAGRI